MVNSIEGGVVGVPVGWVAVVSAYHCSSKVPSVIYTLINLDSVSLYLFLADLIISLLYLVWSSFCAMLCKD